MMSFGTNRSLRIAAAVAVFLAAPPVVPVGAADQAFIGMQVQGVNEVVAQALGLPRVQGVLVRDIALEGPSGQAGLRRGDLIIELAGEDIETFEKLLQVVGKLSSGKNVPVTVLRQGKKTTFELTTGSWPESWRVSKGAFSSIPEVGLTVAAITPKVRERFQLRWGSTGLVVTLLDTAKATGTDLRRGEIIRQVNQEDVWHPRQMMAMYQEAKQAGRKQLLLLVEGVDGFRFSLLPVTQ